MRFRGRDVQTETLVIAALGLVAVPLLLLADPATSSLFPPCPFRAATGWLCPGCGSTRAVHALLHGHVLQALRLNPLAVAALPVVTGHVLLELFGPGDTIVARVGAHYIRALAVVIVGFGIIRNLM